VGSRENQHLLKTAARMLLPVLDDLVFVGGCTTALLITDEAAADVRPTYDVDAVTDVNSYTEYTKFCERLRELGFKEDQSEDAPVCRWRNSEIVLDVMPNDEAILGFSNRWYKDVVQTAHHFPLDEDLNIRVVTAPYFLGTKLEAFKGRGKGDFVTSQDLEDLISVVDGRPTLVDEIRESPTELSAYIASEIALLLANSDFVSALSGFLLPDRASQGRLPSLLEKLGRLETLGNRR